ncbi:hypothetical protein H8F21_16210 [Pseudomonas sp. P66]|uniref:Uncharacterized protein n=1 Tax=Pseudomonas arcuscaelestis TaxID=2710591 RepID=A0ABS2C186_9PSED|nr:hypothetical protein [Pseudomonas arcuscaelestis]MBM5459113.1 hypothetical protein [Pseudomonas arcuscaelestis]
MKRQKKDLREADMSTYGQFAWQDALSLAKLLKRSFDLEALRENYESFSVEDNHEFEKNNAEIIQELISKTEGQRPAYLRRVCKNASNLSQGVLIVLAIIAQVRVTQVIELRDRFRYSLYPGGGNRNTCAGIYAFNNAMMDVSFMAWPTAVFEALSARESEREAEWALIKPYVDEWAKAYDSYKDDA